ncbi:MAG: ribose-phosphate pyrophosphokinase [Oscillospiraceae bacterium]|nr:ribose-phosphate pyrophosphokinase [Oscillospiraceae bacterium]MDD7355212.1 ribose-phosphate pyrophosphokinase [Oscillospiraceae bacterium]MDY3936991.1 ribose-phosphate pyrophosphokinase [Oscillospiraceae bacterium]
MPDLSQELTNIPVGPLGIIALPGCEELAKKVDDYIVSWRRDQVSEHKTSIAFSGYQKDSYILDCRFHRFGTGEGKAVFHESVRGYDLYFIVDVFNYGVTYNMYGKDFPTSPDDHYANLKRAIAATAGKARRLNVIMPMLYEGRQHKRTARESLDCALALQELCNLYGVENIITFDAHDPRVQNSIPNKGFENVTTTYQMIKALVKNVPDLVVNKDKLMIISPDEGGLGRCIYYSTVLGVELGMFYKRRDYSVIVNGRNPILAHEFLGDNVEGKDVIVVDDMISSGDSMLEVASKLKELKAKRIFVCSAFGLFCNGLDAFDKAYADGLINGIFTTNLIYRSPELLKRDWFFEVNMSKYVALLIDTLNNDKSLSELLSPVDRIESYLAKYAHRE